MFEIGDRVISKKGKLGTVFNIVTDDPFDTFPIKIEWDDGSGWTSHTLDGSYFTCSDSDSDIFLYEKGNDKLEQYVEEYDQKYGQYLRGEISYDHWTRYCTDILLLIMKG